MAHQGLIHIVTKTTRSGHILWDEVWCDDCVRRHLQAFGSDKGVTITQRPWEGEVRACTSCDDSELAPELQSDAVRR